MFSFSSSSSYNSTSSAGKIGNVFGFFFLVKYSISRDTSTPPATPNPAKLIVWLWSAKREDIIKSFKICLQYPLF